MDARQHIRDIVDLHLSEIETKKFYPSELRLSNFQNELLREIYLADKPLPIEHLSRYFNRSSSLISQEIRKLERKGVGIDHWDGNRVSLNTFVKDAQVRTNFLGIAGKESF